MSMRSTGLIQLNLIRLYQPQRWLLLQACACICGPRLSLGVRRYETQCPFLLLHSYGEDYS
jgi:hypothetical protein